MIRFVLCIFIALSVSASAFASVYDFHNEPDHSAQSLGSGPEHAGHSETGASDNCADHCVSHCSMWHVLNLSLSENVALNPQVEEQKPQWFFISVSESSYSNRLWRPPSLLS